MSGGGGDGRAWVFGVAGVLVVVAGLSSLAKPAKKRSGSAVRVGLRLRAAATQNETVVGVGEVAVRAIEPQSGQVVEVWARRGWSAEPLPYAWLSIQPIRGMIGDEQTVAMRVVDDEQTVAMRVVDALSMSGIRLSWNTMTNEEKEQARIGVCLSVAGKLVLTRFEVAIAAAAMTLRHDFRSPPPTDLYFVGGLLADGRTRLVEQVVPLWKPFAHEPGGRALGDTAPQLVAPVGTAVEVDLGGAKASTKVGRGSRPFHGWTLHGITNLFELRSFANDQEWGEIPF